MPAVGAACCGYARHAVLPVQQSTRIDFVINLKTAMQLAHGQA